MSDGLVTIRMKPDDHGRFGFNVKVCDCCCRYGDVNFITN